MLVILTKAFRFPFSLYLSMLYMLCYACKDSQTTGYIKHVDTSNFDCWKSYCNCNSSRWREEWELRLLWRANTNSVGRTLMWKGLTFNTGGIVHFLTDRVGLPIPCPPIIRKNCPLGGSQCHPDPHLQL